ncbi:ATP-binding protein [Undibacterium sp. TJN25]|uniref:ATP-binding protein n=1 Tax=Undibacterium sp. TJN25 TaxID=3413056 RepID=UPI003BF137B9
MGKLILERDWSGTPLGPISGWPQSLKTSVSLMLSSRQPMWIGWGPEATFLYNDAYIDVLSLAKHPSALGRPAAEVWAEIWDICGPLADIVFNQGDATVVDDVRLFMNRGDFLEETYYSFSYSPIRDEAGQVSGLFCPNLDTTAKYLNARRLETLSQLSSKALMEKTVAAACASAVGILRENSADIPFSLLYLADRQGRSARLEQSSNLADTVSVAPEWIDLQLAQAPWPVADVIHHAKAQLTSLAGIKGLPEGLAGQAIQQAMCLPLSVPGQEQPAGVLVLGVNPTRRLDHDYRTFFELVATQVANAIQNAQTAEDEKTRADMLAEIDRSKTLFFSNVSHEFRTPLTLMLGPIEEALADEENRLPAAQHERLELVRRNALRLQKLVNTLLEFSRMQAGRVQARFIKTDFAALVTDLASSFRSTIEHAGMQLLVDCAVLEKTVYLDSAMWEKIVLNLLSNAFKFTFEGEIRVSLRSTATHAVLCISDTGVGIPVHELPRLFERFHRIENSRARTLEGSGIGLALVHDLVSLHGGDIRVESEVGRGTAFFISIPTGKEHLAAELIGEEESPSTPAVAAQAYVAEAERWTPTSEENRVETIGAQFLTEGAAMPQESAGILVVDDNADMRAYLVRLLQARWRVKAVNNGQQALEAARREPPALIISDVMMPVLDGFGLLAALRADEQTKDVPFVLLSARAGEEARVEGLQAGADEYLVKPFSGKELMVRVESLLMRQRIRSIQNAFADRMRSIFAQAPAAIAITRGPEHIFEQANSHYLELIGGREVIGLPFHSAIPELADQPVHRLLNEVYASAEPYVGQSVPVLLRGGEQLRLEERFFNFVYQPLLNEEGRSEGIAIVGFEVTELVNAQRAAETANRTKDEFLAMLGHELRNPLAPIITAIQLMRLRGITVAEKERAIIERQAKHLVALVDDLLDVSRVAQGKISLRKTNVEVSDIIARAVETASPLLEEKFHALDINVPATGLCVNGDPERLAQVIANLLTNSAKYTEQRGHIRIDALPSEDGAKGQVCISVTDNGIGIAQDMLPNVFDMFVQERQALNRSRGGLGLGLAIAKSMVKLHDGSISAESGGLGQGSSFRVRLPLSGCEQASPAPDAEIEKMPPAFVDGTLAVLIVDDNEDAARLLNETLTLLRYRTEVAYDGPSAIRAAETFRPDVALLDIGLPGMDGYELASRLRGQSNGQPLRLIAITGYGQEADRQRSLQAGFDEHIVKPVDPARLEVLLQKIAGEILQ